MFVLIQNRGQQFVYLTGTFDLENKKGNEFKTVKTISLALAQPKPFYGTLSKI